MNGLSLLVTAKDHRGLREFAASNMAILCEADELVFMVTGGRGQANIANQFAARAFYDVVGLVHSDCLFGEKDLVTLSEAARKKKVSGVVGAKLLEGNEDWPAKFIWGNAISEETKVSTLDGCSVFFRKDIPIHFDETFTSFHLVVEDFCISAQRLGIPVVVPVTNAKHVGQSTHKPEWQREYARWKEVLTRKWARVRFETT